MYNDMYIVTYIAQLITERTLLQRIIMNIHKECGTVNYIHNMYNDTIYIYIHSYIAMYVNGGMLDSYYSVHTKLYLYMCLSIVIAGRL